MSIEPTYYTLTREQLASQLNCTPRSVDKMRASGLIPKPFKLGTLVRWPASEIQAWVDAGAPPADEWEAIKARQAKLEARGLATNTK